MIHHDSRYNLEPTNMKQWNNVIITANLPYLTPAQYCTNPELKFEPKTALIGGPDGLKYYKQLLKQIKLLTTYNLLSTTYYLELNPQQKTPLEKLVQKYLPKAQLSFKKDLAGKTRVAIIT